MFSRIHEKLGTAGFVISIVALIAALTGGAYAAGALSPQVKKQITKESKKFSKKFSKQFAQVGPQGPQGNPGAPGAKGDTGSSGANGSPGTNGTNGTNGEPGMCSEAEPECALPSGAVLTGKWAIAGGESDFELATISFPLRVSPPPTALREGELAGFTVGYELQDGNIELYGPNTLSAIEEALGEGEDPTPLVEEDKAAFEAACPGSPAEPEATSGFLCIYQSDQGPGVRAPTASVGFKGTAEAAGEFGVTIPFETTAKGAFARGTWAVAK